MSIRCDTCGHANTTDARFCNQCGRRVSGTAQTDYTPQHLKDRILTTRAALEGERKQVTVVFVDVKGSVRLSQQVDAEEWHRIMDRFFEILTQSIHAFEGTVNQYTGDGVMALFGAPIAHEDHAQRACMAALRIRREMLALSASLEERLGEEFAVRIGLNSGEVIVGKIGDDLRMDYTAKGPTVGLAARMERLARPNTIRLTEHTARLVEGYFELVARGDAPVPGVEGRVRMFELRQATAARRRFEIARKGGLPRFAGREAELELLDAYCRQAHAGTGLMVAVVSETGLGKSRLCHEFVKTCRRDGVQVFESRGVSHRRAEPLLPLLDMLREFIGIEPDDDSLAALAKTRSALEPYEPVGAALRDNLLEALGLQPASGGVDDTQRLARLLELIARLLQHGALDTPSVILMENLQWLEIEQTRGFLDMLVAAVAQLPVLLLVTCRPDYSLRWSDLPHFRKLELKPLDEAALGHLLDDLLGKAEGLGALKQQLIERAGGSPLFVEEMVRDLIGRGVLQRNSDGCRQVKPVEADMLPPSVHAVVAARIDGLNADAKRLLQVAAVIGREFDEDLLRSVSGLKVAPYRQCMKILIDGEFLYRDEDQGGQFEFQQSLTRQVAYQALLQEQRADIHREVARYLQAHGGGDEASIRQIARHQARAGDAQLAAGSYAQAAELGAAHDLNDALCSLDKALDQLDAADAPAALRLRTLARWLHLAARCGVDEKRIDSVIAQAERLVDQAGPGERALYWMARGTGFVLAGDPDEGIAWYEQALATAEEADDDELRVVCATGLVFGLMTAGRLGEAHDEAAAALLLAAGREELGRAYIGHSAVVAIQEFQAWIVAQMGELAAGLEAIDAALEVARRHDDVEQIAIALTIKSMIACERGACEQTEQPAEEAVALAEQSGHVAALVVARIVLARVHLRRGHWADAVTLLEAALGESETLHTGLNETARIEMYLAEAHLAGRDTSQARDHAAAALKQAHARGTRVLQAEAELVAVRAGLLSRKPFGYLRRYASALERAQELIDMTGARYLQPRWHVLNAKWHQLKGHDETARDELARADALFVEMGIQPSPLFAELAATLHADD